MINIKEFRVDKLVLLITLCRKKEYAQYLQKPQFSDLGVMLDVSRNPVMRVEKVKKY